MKRFLLLIAATLTFSAASAQDSKVTFNDLPADAINFVRQHFLVDLLTEHSQKRIRQLI